MTFDNSKTIISIRIKLFAATVALLTYIVLTYIARMIHYPLLGMSDTTWTLLLVGLYLIYAFLPMILNYHYISFSDDGENIVIRYFTAGIVAGRKNSIEIGKRSFAGYKNESRLLGLDKSIILFQNFQEGVAKYPPVHISGLTSKERSRLYNALNQHTAKP
jgi:hypothetical protein